MITQGLLLASLMISGTTPNMPDVHIRIEASSSTTDSSDLVSRHEVSGLGIVTVSGTTKTNREDLSKEDGVLTISVSGRPTGEATVLWTREFPWGGRSFPEIHILVPGDRESIAIAYIQPDFLAEFHSFGVSGSVIEELSRENFLVYPDGRREKGDPFRIPVGRILSLYYGQHLSAHPSHAPSITSMSREGEDWIVGVNYLGIEYLFRRCKDCDFWQVTDSRKL